WNVSYSTRAFTDVAKGIECLSGDVFRVYVQHSEGSAVNVTGNLTVEMVDRTIAQAAPGVPNVATAVTERWLTTRTNTHQVALPNINPGDPLVVAVAVPDNRGLSLPDGWTVLDSASDGEFEQNAFEV